MFRYERPDSLYRDRFFSLHPKKRRSAMKVSRAVDNCLEYHRVNSQKNTLISYEFLLSKFSAAFGDRELESITSEEILSSHKHQFTFPNSHDRQSGRTNTKNVI